MKYARNVEWIGYPEVVGDGSLQDRVRSASVGAPGGGGEGGQADIGPPAPVSGYLAEREEPRLAAVRGDPDAVDPRAAYHRNSPAPVGTRAEQREGVVVDPQPFAPLQLFDLGAERGELVGKIRAGEQDLGGRRQRALARAQTSTGEGRLEQAVEQLDAPFDAEIVGRASRSADQREQPAARVQQRKICFHSASIDRQHEPLPPRPVCHRASLM